MVYGPKQYPYMVQCHVHVAYHRHTIKYNFSYSYKFRLPSQLPTDGSRIVYSYQYMYVRPHVRVVARVFVRSACARRVLACSRARVLVCSCARVRFCACTCTYACACAVCAQDREREISDVDKFPNISWRELIPIKEWLIFIVQFSCIPIRWFTHGANSLC